MIKRRELKEIREEQTSKLVTRVVELKVKLAHELMPSLGKETKNVKIAGGIKKDIAKLLTIIGEQERKQTK